MLERTIDVDHGLLRDLRRRQIIDYSQCASITNISLTPFDKVRKLLDYISQKCETDLGIFDEFITCLKANSQQHVENLLRIQPGI